MQHQDVGLQFFDNPISYFNGDQRVQQIINQSEIVTLNPDEKLTTICVAAFPH
mgnify:CR=1 FL=1